MPEVYDAAALRHYHDAERLAAIERFDNAGHLVGFAAECALKHHFGVTAASESPKTHLPEIAATMRKRFSARDPRQATMRDILDRFGDAFFAGWNVNRRYDDTGATTQAEYNQWRDQARRTLGAAGLRLITVEQA